MKEESLSPAMQQFARFKREHPDAILLFRMGDFYETFFDDAKLAAQVLGITLTSRTKGIPMAGFPHHAAAGYIRKLIQANHRVAVCEQVEDPKTAKGLVDRDVVQVVTPGTVTDESYLDSRQANYLVCVFADGNTAGVAWADLSTGSFVAHETLASEVGELIARLAPPEVLLPESDAMEMGTVHNGTRGGQSPFPWLADSTAMVSRAPLWTFGRDEARKLLNKHFGTLTLEGFGCDGLTAGLSAAGALLAYLTETQKVHLAHITRLERWHPESFMHLDRSTRYSLELVRTMRTGEREGALLGVLDRTTTAMGARMLYDWILSPLRDVTRIRERLEGVEEFFTQGILRGQLRDALGSVWDVERLTTRVATQRANARDLLALGESLAALPALRALLAGARSPMLTVQRDLVDPVEELAALVLRAVAPEPPVTLHDGGLIRKGYSPELDELRAIGSGGKQWLAEYQAAESQRTGIPSLRVGFNQVFGYYIEITHTHAERVPDNYTRKQTLKNAERYITPELKEYESKVLSADERAKQLEYDLFLKLRDEAARYTARLQQTARALATLDVLASLAQVGAENRYVRPSITNDRVLRIKDGRHPVLEQMLVAEKFVPNDTMLDGDSRQIAIITGPNMAGKSTYIRQVALITLMAQMGSFVPAAEASIGVADRIFTRVGASDELARGQSTFMVEMTETANILNNASPKSLVILDEIGRGTSTFDGLSIAWAVAEHLHEKVGARTLFATHYHELTDLALMLPRVINCNVRVQEYQDDVIFLRKIVEGATDKSYGIHVARLAGIPAGVVKRAKTILANLEEEELDPAGKPKLAHANAASGFTGPAFVQLGLFAQPNPAVEQIKTLDVDRMTPLEALTKLKELKDKLEE